MSNFLPNKQNRNVLPVLVLLSIFAICVLSVLLMGANAYHRLTTRDQAAYERRTCAQYLATKVRQAPVPDAVFVSSFGGEDALVFAENIEGETYLTRIYCCDGWLRELFSAADGIFVPEDGEKVLPAQALCLTLKDGLLSVQITDSSGRPIHLKLSIRGGGGGAVS